VRSGHAVHELESLRDARLEFLFNRDHPMSEFKSPVNYVFVDYENVPDVDHSLIGARTVHLTLLLGARQTKLDAALVEKLMAHASAVQLVRLNSSGKNALDFALAYYMGRAAQADPNAHFHIVSKDTGFDPLIEHLRTRHVHARRHPDYSTLTFSTPPKPPAAGPDDTLQRVLEHLRKNTNNRPKRKATLIAHLTAFCGKTSTVAEVEAVIERLRQARHLSIGDKEAVSYHLDSK
jgi:hypothetical protein